MTTTIGFNRNVEPRRLNGKQYEAMMSNTTIEHKLSSHWKKSFNLSVYCMNNAGTFRMGNSMHQQTKIRWYRAGSSMNYRLWNKGIAQLHCVYMKTGQLSSFTAMDAELTFNFKQRCKLNVMAYNLLNHRYFRANELTAMSASDYRRYLNGRSVMIGLEMVF
jgi:outer membrane receptor for ferrienterochelin and colicin